MLSIGDQYILKKVAGIKIKNTEGNFLSRVKEIEQRRHMRYSSNLVCKIEYFKNGIRSGSNMGGRLLNISAGGALIQPQFILPPHTHLYLVLDNYPFKITAAIVKMAANAVHLKFSKDLPEADVPPIAAGAPYQSILSVGNPN